MLFCIYRDLYTEFIPPCTVKSINHQVQEEIVAAAAIAIQRSISTMPTTTSKNLWMAMAMVACAAVLCGVAAAQAPAPAVTTDPCMDALLNMTSCLTYVESGSTTKKPDEGCCPALAGLVDSNPVCLCDLLGGAASNFGITVDDARALKLPGICSVVTPPPSTCTALGYKIPSFGSPSSSPAPSSGPEIPGSSPGPASSSPSIRSGDNHIIVFMTMALSCLVAAQLFWN